MSGARSAALDEEYRKEFEEESRNDLCRELSDLVDRHFDKFIEFSTGTLNAGTLIDYAVHQYKDEDSASGTAKDPPFLMSLDPTPSMLLWLSYGQCKAVTAQLAATLHTAIISTGVPEGSNIGLLLSGGCTNILIILALSKAKFAPVVLDCDQCIADPQYFTDCLQCSDTKALVGSTYILQSLSCARRCAASLSSGTTTALRNPSVIIALEFDAYNRTYCTASSSSPSSGCSNRGHGSPAHRNVVAQTAAVPLNVTAATTAFDADVSNASRICTDTLANMVVTDDDFKPQYGQLSIDQMIEAAREFASKLCTCPNTANHTRHRPAGSTANTGGRTTGEVHLLAILCTRVTVTGTGTQVENRYTKSESIETVFVHSTTGDDMEHSAGCGQALASTEKRSCGAVEANVEESCAVFVALIGSDADGTLKKYPLTHHQWLRLGLTWGCYTDMIDREAKQESSLTLAFLTGRTPPQPKAKEVKPQRVLLTTAPVSDFISCCAALSAALWSRSCIIFGSSFCHTLACCRIFKPENVSLYTSASFWHWWVSVRLSPSAFSSKRISLSNTYLKLHSTAVIDPRADNVLMEELCQNANVGTVALHWAGIVNATAAPSINRFGKTYPSVALLHPEDCLPEVSSDVEVGTSIVLAWPHTEFIVSACEHHKGPAVDQHGNVELLGLCDSDLQSVDPFGGVVGALCSVPGPHDTSVPVRRTLLWRAPVLPVLESPVPESPQSESMKVPASSSTAVAGVVNDDHNSKRARSEEERSALRALEEDLERNIHVKDFRSDFEKERRTLCSYTLPRQAVQWTGLIARRNKKGAVFVVSDVSSVFTHNCRHIWRRYLERRVRNAVVKSKLLYSFVTTTPRSRYASDSDGRQCVCTNIESSCTTAAGWTEKDNECCGIVGGLMDIGVRIHTVAPPWILPLAEKDILAIVQFPSSASAALREQYQSTNASSCLHELSALWKLIHKSSPDKYHSAVEVATRVEEQPSLSLRTATSAEGCESFLPHERPTYIWLVDAENPEGEFCGQNTNTLLPRPVNCSEKAVFANFDQFHTGTGNESSVLFPTQDELTKAEHQKLLIKRGQLPEHDVPLHDATVQNPIPSSPRPDMPVQDADQKSSSSSTDQDTKQGLTSQGLTSQGLTPQGLTPQGLTPQGLLYVSSTKMNTFVLLNKESLYLLQCGRLN